MPKKNAANQNNKYNTAGNISMLFLIAIVIFLCASYDLFEIIYPMYIVVPLIVVCFVLLIVGLRCWMIAERIIEDDINQEEDMDTQSSM